MSTNSNTFDDRTEKELATLTPTAQSQFRVFLGACRDADIDFRLIDGTRTAAEQNRIYAQGRTAPGDIVTKARAWFSNHNFAIACDGGVFINGVWRPESPLYAKAGKIGRDLGLEWGGDWVSINDQPHFQCRTGKTVSELRAIVKAHGGTLAGAMDAIDALILPLKGVPSKPSVPAVPPKTPWQVVAIGKSVGGIFRNDDGDIIVPARVFVEANLGTNRAAKVGRQKINATDGWLLDDGKLLKDAHGLEIPAPLINGVAYARVRALAEAYNIRLDLDDKNRIVTATPE